MLGGLIICAHCTTLTTTFTLFYIGICENMFELHLVQQHMERVVARMISNGEITVPGFTVRPLEVPQDILGESPRPPQLTMIVFGGPRKLQPRVPADLIKMYSGHTKFGAEFKNMQDSFNEAFVWYT